jgi:acyl-CoA hydrolase
MDTVASLYEKFIHSQLDDIQNGCAQSSVKTQTLLAFYQEVVYRQSAAVDDTLTANQLLTYTHQNY